MDYQIALFAYLRLLNFCAGLRPVWEGTFHSLDYNFVLDLADCRFVSTFRILRFNNQDIIIKQLSCILSLGLKDYSAIRVASLAIDVLCCCDVIG